MTDAILFLFLLGGLVFPVVLYVLVRAEHDKRETMNREEAERVARRDTDEER